MTGMLKTIAWNGVRLSIPSTWEIGRIEARHLFFDSPAGPAMEIKWGPVKGRFSHRSHLKKLIAQQKHRPGKNLEEWQFPPTWKNALSKFIAKGFSWQLDTENGRGAILFCPSCKTAIMFQFFNIKGANTDAAILKVLKSLRDHRKDNQIAWAVFDIQALLPGTFQLNGYQFKPGNYQLAFSDKFQSLKLFRWAPASAFLTQSSLSQFAANTLDLNQADLDTILNLEHPAVEWQVNNTPGWHHRLFPFKRNPAFHWARVWHVPDKNRILGMRLHSKNPIDANMTREICGNYGVVPS
jgi:hypothetical protein